MFLSNRASSFWGWQAATSCRDTAALAVRVTCRLVKRVRLGSQKSSCWRGNCESRTNDAGKEAAGASVGRRQPSAQAGGSEPFPPTETPSEPSADPQDFINISSAHGKSRMRITPLICEETMEEAPGPRC